MQVGNYSTILSAGFGGVSNGVIYGADVELSQTAIVPSGTESLRFITQPGATNFSVSMNGNPLTLFPLLTTTNQIVWGADLHGWADQTAELRFTSIAQQPYMSRVRYLYLDDISFSSIAVPEPSTWALLALGSALLWRAARYRGKKVE